MPRRGVDERLDLSRRLGAGPEPPHVALGQQPVAEADAAQQQRPPVAVDELGALAPHESVEVAGRGAKVRANGWVWVGH